MYLIGDIGGTKTRLAVFSPETGPRVLLAEATFPSTDYPNLETVVRQFLAEIDIPVERASFGVAGPVVHGRATITNLPWVIDEAQLQEACQFSSVRLLNDLEAISSAVPFLEPDDLCTLNTGQTVSDGAIAVIAPGTGLGEGFLTWDGTRYYAFASEGGHTDFAPMNALEIGLLQYLQERIDHVSYEHVCSGRLGIPNIYAYLKDSSYAEEPDWLTAQFAATNDPTPVIAQAADAKSSELCVKTFEMFVSILGAEAGNLALTVMATGGVYLGGGIPKRILPMLRDERFMQAFRYKGRFASLMNQIPVHVMTHPRPALLGAAHYGFDL